MRRAGLCAGVSLLTLGASALPAHADQVLDHDSMVTQLMGQENAAPLVADCAAHAAFVVPTSNLYDHVAFLPEELNSQHATVEPWNQPFDSRKQRVTVDTMVQVSGLGYRKNGASDPDLLHFRCGYVENKLLAFSYNEPEQAPVRAEAPVRGSHGRARTHGRPVHGQAVHGRGHERVGNTRHSAARPAGKHTAARPTAKSAHAAPSHKASKSAPAKSKSTKSTKKPHH